MPTVRYTVANGEIIAEKRNGVRRTYVPDPLGSTVALLDNNQQKTDTFSYWPYGEVKTRTGNTPTPFQYVGTLGYYRDSTGRTYVRARHYQQRYGRWMTVDPDPILDENNFSYCGNNCLSMVDPTGAWYINWYKCSENDKSRVRKALNNICDMAKLQAMVDCLHAWTCPVGEKYPQIPRDLSERAGTLGDCVRSWCENQKDIDPSRKLRITCCGWNTACYYRCFGVCARSFQGKEIQLCPSFWDNSKCGSIECALLHELIHVCGVIGHGVQFECILQYDPNCLFAAGKDKDQFPDVAK
jgi:RHS repeat-associated protein